jgi:4-alpha-glucanotransferase
MPKKTGTEFFYPAEAPYLSVVSPSTHDMSTVREWWEEDRARTKRFYNTVLGHPGEAPLHCEPEINKEIVLMHLYSPAMWSIFQLQDLFGMNGTLRREDPREERVNQPSNSQHYWRYRMHIPLEDLLNETDFNAELKASIVASGRG